MRLHPICNSGKPARVGQLQAGGLIEISRGLSDSDTPGSRSISPHPGGVSELRAQPNLCHPFRVDSFLSPTGGIVALLLNPRLISFSPPGYHEETDGEIVVQSSSVRYSLIA